MISILEARQLISNSVAARPVQRQPLARVRGRVLAEPVVADAFYPAGDRSMMDGYVVRADAVAGEFRVVGEIPAGAVPSHRLQAGEAMRIFTGALLPEDGGRVIMQEDVRRAGETITVDTLSERLFVRARGAEGKPGDVLLPAGTRLGAAEMAILAQVGALNPSVVTLPVIRHIATGGELVSPATTPGPGQIRDTNSTMLAAQFAELGVEQVHAHCVPDDLSSLIGLGSLPCDLLVISGGASVGDYDFGAEALRKLGFTIHFDRVNLRPGKPLTFATRGAQAAFVVPGNPVSHFVCYHLGVRLAIERLCGLVPAWNLVRLPLHGGEPLQAESRETYWLARTQTQDGRLVVVPKRWSTSGDTFSLAGTNALVRVNAQSPADGIAETLLLDLPAGA